MRHDLATFLRDLVQMDPLTTPEGLAWIPQRARDLLAGKPPRRNGIPKPTPPGKTKTQRQEEHRASTKELRAMVFERSASNCTCGGGHCEACAVDLGQSWDMHHVEGGGLRRSKQRLGNVLALCWECHRRAHRGDLDTLRKISAAVSLDAEAVRAAQHRLEKMLEARGVPVRVETEGR